MGAINPDEIISILKEEIKNYDEISMQCRRKGSTNLDRGFHESTDAEKYSEIRCAVQRDLRKAGWSGIPEESVLAGKRRRFHQLLSNEENHLVLR